MRRKFLLIAVAAVVGMSAAAVNGLTQRGGRGQAPPLDIQEVADGLYVIIGSGGNVSARVTSDGVIIVDDKFERNYDEIIARIKGVTNQPVKYVFNTHNHGDHVGGNPRFGALAQILAHTNVRRQHAAERSNPGPPTMVYTDQASVHLGDAEVLAIHFGRGHTKWRFGYLLSGSEDHPYGRPVRQRRHAVH